MSTAPPPASRRPPPRLPARLSPRVRRGLLGAWMALLAAVLYLHVFGHGAAHQTLERLLAAPGWIGALIYFGLGCLRGFTLIPATTLVLAGVALFPPTPLWLLTLGGIAVSSASIYFFAEALGLDLYFERRHPRELARLRRALARYELPVIIGWSFFPLAPTDLICYVCGALRLEFWRLLLGVMLGEGAICAIYIYGASFLWRLGR